jgi:phytoene dehydrogenase-like protein
MLAAAEHVIPGLGQRLVFSAVGTPLTNDYYCETVRGAVYGTEKTPLQVGPFSFSTETPLPGLFLCGASTICHGVVTAAASGLRAAQSILGARDMNDLLAPPDGSLRIYPSEHPERWPKDAEPGDEAAI